MSNEPPSHLDVHDSFVKSDSIRIATREFAPVFPTRSVPIVLLHGLGGSLADWTPIARRLAHGRRVVAFDMRGSGKSDTGPWSWEAALDDLEAVIKHYQLATPMVVGWSLGGMVAALWGHRNPSSATVINLDGHPVPGPPDQYEGLAPDVLHGEIERLRKQFLEMVSAHPPAMTEAQVASMVEATRSPAKDDEAADRAEEAIRRRLQQDDDGWLMKPGVETLTQILGELEQLDLVKVYAESAAATLVVLATKDVAGQEEFAELMAAHRRGLNREFAKIAETNDRFRVINFAGADHAMVMTHEDEIVKLIWSSENEFDQ